MRTTPYKRARGGQWHGLRHMERFGVSLKEEKSKVGREGDRSFDCGIPRFGSLS